MDYLKLTCNKCGKSVYSVFGIIRKPKGITRGGKSTSMYCDVCKEYTPHTILYESGVDIKARRFGALKDFEKGEKFEEVVIVIDEKGFYFEEWEGIIKGELGSFVKKVELVKEKDRKKYIDLEDFTGGGCVFIKIKTEPFGYDTYYKLTNKLREYKGIWYFYVGGRLVWEPEARYEQLFRGKIKI